MSHMNTVTKMPLTEHAVQNIMKIGEAMIFGKEVKPKSEGLASITLSPTSTNRDSAQIIEWLGEDYQNNSALLERLVTEMTTRMSPTLHCGFNPSCTSYILDTEAINSYAQKSFSNDINDIVSSMFSENLTAISSSTLALAKKVADMDNSNSDIETWAKTLSNDISKGRD